MSESALISIVLITIKGKAGKFQSTCQEAGEKLPLSGACGIKCSLFRHAKTPFHPSTPSTHPSVHSTGHGKIQCVPELPTTLQ